MIFLFRNTLQRFWLLLALPLTLLMAMMFIPNASAEEGGWNKVEVQVEPQRLDIDNDGDLETFSADFVVYPDGTTVGQIFLDSNYPVAIEENSVAMTANGHLNLSMEGINQADGIHYTIDLSHELPGSTNGGGGVDIGDDILFDIVDSVTGSHHTFEVWIQISIR